MVSSPAIPSLPPNVFVPLIPVVSNSPYYPPASLKFSCRVNAVASSTCPASASPSSQSPRIPGTSELGDHRFRPSRTWLSKLVELRMYHCTVLGDGGDTITLEGVGAGGHVCVGENCPVGTSAIPGQVSLLIFHDTTPVLSVRSSTGVFEIHLDEVDKLGVDFGFWIAIALAYGEFLVEREGYLAATTD